jgi:hypothetical protein
VTLGAAVGALSGDFSILFDGSLEVVAAAAARQCTRLFGGGSDHTKPAGAITRLVITVRDNGATPLQAQVDESYALTIDHHEAVLGAQTVWGALHGLTTFAQLVGRCGLLG